MKTFEIVPIKSTLRQLETLICQVEDLNNVIIVHVPDDTDEHALAVFKTKLIATIPDKTLIILPQSIQFCELKEIKI